MKSRTARWSIAAAALVACGLAGLQLSRAQVPDESPFGVPNDNPFGGPQPQVQPGTPTVVTPNMPGPPLPEYFPQPAPAPTTPQPRTRPYPPSSNAEPGPQRLGPTTGFNNPPVVYRDPADPRAVQPRPVNPLEAEVHRAAQALRQAQGDEAKAAATKELTAALERYFDDDMKRRDEELTQMEKRLTELRTQLNRRKAKRQDIINAQLTISSNEADGMGFFSNWEGVQPGPQGNLTWPTNAKPWQYNTQDPNTGGPQGAPLNDLFPPSGNRPREGNIPSGAPPAGAPRPGVPRPIRGRDGQNSAEMMKAKTQVTLLQNALETYKLNTQKLPGSLQELVARPDDAAIAKRWDGPYLPGATVPPDPWGNPFQFAARGMHNPSSFDVWSWGPDGQNGTNDDIGNWLPNPPTTSAPTRRPVQGPGQPGGPPPDMLDAEQPQPRALPGAVDQSRYEALK